MMAAVLALALLPRLALAAVGFYHQQDEVWQYIEPAHGLLTGSWIRTWEWREGIRGWLLPELVAGPLWLGRLLVGNAATMVLIRMALALLSLGIVVSGMVIAARVSRLHAIVTGLVLATSFELVFFASRPSSEAVATDLLLPAAALLTRAPARRGRALLAGTGALLGFAFVLRFQFAPALGVLALLTLRADWRAWSWVILGAVAALAIGGLADAAQGTVPLRWMVENVRLNLVSGRSEKYGVAPWWWYFANQAQLWGSLTVPMVALIALGARRPAIGILVTVALVNIAFHSLVPHKEYRFIYPSVALLLVVAGIGTADTLELVRRKTMRVAAAGVLALFWGGVSAAAVLASVSGGRLHGAPQMAMWRMMSAMPELCGIASLRSFDPVSLAFIDRSVPVYMFDEGDATAAARANARAYNALITQRSGGGRLIDIGYRERRCFAKRSESRSGETDLQYCVFERPGGCEPGDARYLENNVRVRTRD